MGHHISISTRNVGTHFGTVGVARVNGASVETDVLPFGFDSAARQQAYEAALRAGLLREVGEANAEYARVAAACLRIGAMLLLDKYVVVAGTDPRPDSLICMDLENLLTGDA